MSKFFFILAGLAGLAALTLGYIATWSVDPRWDGTADLTGASAFILGVVGVFTAIAEADL